jgi:hypothetical protein
VAEVEVAMQPVVRVQVVLLSVAFRVIVVLPVAVVAEADNRILFIGSLHHCPLGNDIMTQSLYRLSATVALAFAKLVPPLKLWRHAVCEARSHTCTTLLHSSKYNIEEYSLLVILRAIFKFSNFQISIT